MALAIPTELFRDGAIYEGEMTIVQANEYSRDGIPLFNPSQLEILFTSQYHQKTENILVDFQLICPFSGL